MKATTLAILNLIDSLPGGRNAFLYDIAPLCADKVFLSAESVALRYDVSLSCVRSWSSKGILVPSMKIPGGTARYTLDDLAKFEEENKRKAETT